MIDTNKKHFSTNAAEAEARGPAEEALGLFSSKTSTMRLSVPSSFLLKFWCDKIYKMYFKIKNQI